MTELEIKVISKDNKIEKELKYKNGRVKKLIYEKCRSFIICKDLQLKEAPAISVYPSMKSLVERFKKLNNMEKNKLRGN